MKTNPIPDITECAEIGKISRPHGKDGEVLIITHACDHEDLKDRKYVFFCLQERLVPFFIESVTLKSNSVFVKFEDFDSMEKAEQYCGTRLFIESCSIAETEEDDSDLEGFTVVEAASGKEIGIIKEVIAYSMNVVLDVERKGKPSVLIPLAEELLKGIDEDAKRITLEIPSGILEEE